MSDLVGNPEDRISRDMALIVSVPGPSVIEYYEHTYFLLIKCENLLHCKGFSHFINK